jgi:hypothetical protein
LLPSVEKSRADMNELAAGCNRHAPRCKRTRHTAQSRGSR